MAMCTNEPAKCYRLTLRYIGFRLSRNILPLSHIYEMAYSRMPIMLSTVVLSLIHAGDSMPVVARRHRLSY